MPNLIADILILFYIIIIYIGLQIDNDNLLEGLEKTSNNQIIIGSFFVIVGFYIISLIKFGNVKTSNPLSLILWFIICYETFGLFLIVLKKEWLLMFLRKVSNANPKLLKLPSLIEIFGLVYLLVYDVKLYFLH